MKLGLFHFNKFYELSNINDHSDKKNMMIKLSQIFSYILSLRVNVKAIYKSFITIKFCYYDNTEIKLILFSLFYCYN
jgi:hypothetical protein